MCVLSMGKEGPYPHLERTERVLPSHLPPHRYFFYRQWPRARTCACRNHGISPTGESTDPRTVSSRELHVQPWENRAGLPSFADLTRAPRPDPARGGEQAAALRERTCLHANSTQARRGARGLDIYEHLPAQ